MSCINKSNRKPLWSTPPPPQSGTPPPPSSPSVDICKFQGMLFKDCPGLKAHPGFRKSCDTETKKDLVEANHTCSSQQISTMWNDWEKCCGKKSGLSGLSTGALVGIICGSVAVLFLIGFVYFRSTRKGRRGKR